MSNNIDLNKYKDFVSKVTSLQSNETEEFVKHIFELEANALKDNIPLKFALLLTSSTGLASEGGEFAEIVKKLAFQGKPFTEETRFHMKRELGDIFWYWVNACRALDYDPNDVITENVDKLKSRYPSGEFDVYYSENRKDGDL